MKERLKAIKEKPVLERDFQSISHDVTAGPNRSELLLKWAMAISTGTITKIDIHNFFTYNYDPNYPSTSQDLALLLMSMQTSGQIKTIDLSNNMHLFNTHLFTGANLSNHLTEENPFLANIFANMLKANPNLEQLNLGSSNIQDRSMVTIAKAIESHPNLKFLDISHNNKLSAFGLAALKECVYKSKSLTEINIVGLNQGLLHDTIDTIMAIRPDINIVAAYKGADTFIDDLSDINFVKYVEGLQSLLTDTIMPAALGEIVLDYLAPGEEDGFVTIMGLESNHEVTLHATSDC